MNIRQLKEYIDKLVEELQNGDKNFLRSRLKTLLSAFPFNEYEYMLMYLRDRSIITFDEYEKLRNNYVSTNKYLPLYEIAPRIFGQVWGEDFLRAISSRFLKANKALDPKFTGEYDVWIDGIRVEVKACRAIHTKKRGSLISKALHYGSSEPFWMNFQQLKPDACDVFIFMGVWVDKIIYWVLSSKEAKCNKYISHQHRGGIEYQIGITEKNISAFDKYVVQVKDLVETVIDKGKK